jgi:hypothetical protein
VAEQVVEQADDLGRRQALGERSEVHDVGEQNRRRAELVGDPLRLGLELLGDRARQDVEQQALGLRLLHAQRRERVPALVCEHGQQREHDRAAHGDVEREHRGREPLGDRRRVRAEQLPREPRAEEHDEVGEVPAHGAPDVAEHERPERGEDPPQPDPAGGEEAAERDHRERRREQDRELADEQERAEVPRAREDDDRREQDHGVRERHPADRGAEREVEGRPDQRDREDQHRDQHEERLAGARVLVVARIRADLRQTREQRLAEAPDPAHLAHGGTVLTPA